MQQNNHKVLQEYHKESLSIQQSTTEKNKLLQRVKSTTNTLKKLLPQKIQSTINEKQRGVTKYQKEPQNTTKYQIYYKETHRSSSNCKRTEYCAPSSTKSHNIVQQTTIQLSNQVNNTLKYQVNIKLLKEKIRVPAIATNTGYGTKQTIRAMDD